MEINKTKCLIYLLTFVGYAWSGYGSTVLASLRDAVLAAENVFGNVMENAVKVLNKLSEVQGHISSIAEEECIFKCPDGSPPKRNKYYKAATNGCGPEGAKVDNAYLPFDGMTKCCNEHDICYGTCNKDKDECDLSFKRCLYRICDNNKQLKEVEFIRTGCKLAAKGFSSATLIGGCPSYLNAQKEACFCPVDTTKRPSNEL